MKRKKATLRTPHAKKQTPENVKYSGHEELKATEEGLIGYSTDIVRQLSSKMNLAKRFNVKPEVLEFGAGSGFLADIWRSVNQVTPDCCEIDPDLIQTIREKGFTCFTSLNDLTRKYHGIYTSNVLEHIADDSNILQDLYHALTSAGVIGIYVPAFPMLFSEMDLAVGHFRRYRRKELISKVEAAGFIIESCTYSDSIGFFASIFLKLLGFKRRSNLGSPKSLKFYDVWIYPISRLLDAVGFKYLLGKNLILVARRI
jgi:hypothetical protein